MGRRKVCERVYAKKAFADELSVRGRDERGHAK